MLCFHLPTVWSRRLRASSFHVVRTILSNFKCKDFAKGFKADNSCETAECTVMKATWLSKVDAKKKV
jgi:hypothetical protein